MAYEINRDLIVPPLHNNTQPLPLGEFPTVPRQLRAWHLSDLVAGEIVYPGRDFVCTDTETGGLYVDVAAVMDGGTADPTSLIGGLRFGVMRAEWPPVGEERQSHYLVDLIPLTRSPISDVPEASLRKEPVTMGGVVTAHWVRVSGFWFVSHENPQALAAEYHGNTTFEREASALNDKVLKRLIAESMPDGPAEGDRAADTPAADIPPRRQRAKKRN